MPTARFAATVTADRTIRIPDDRDLEIGTQVLVIKQAPQPPTDEEADEMIARIRAGAAKIAAGEFESEEEMRWFGSFDDLPRIPADFKFDREEIHERG